VIIKNTNLALVSYKKLDMEEEVSKPWKTKSKLEYIWLDGYKPT
jgi:hypothetical protein